MKLVDLKRAVVDADAAGTPETLEAARRCASYLFLTSHGPKAAIARRVLDALRVPGTPDLGRLARALSRASASPAGPSKPRFGVETEPKRDDEDVEGEDDGEPVPPQRPGESSLQYARRLIELAAIDPFDDEQRERGKRLLRMLEADAGLHREPRRASGGSGCVLELGPMTRAEAVQRLRDLGVTREPDPRVARLVAAAGLE